MPIHDEAVPEGIFSLLDTDLYKLTMQCAILKYLPDIPVTYAFTNRTPDMKLSRTAFQWLEEQIQKLSNITLSSEEHDYLQRTCPYFSQTYLDWLSRFRLRPAEHVKLEFDDASDNSSSKEQGDLRISVEGRWVDTILYEIPLLALTSEAYFKFCDTDWSHDGQLEKAQAKGLQLLENGCIFSEFGTRRRRDYQTMELVMQGLLHAAEEGRTKGFPGKLSGTSNVHFAMRYGIPPVGTVAHEWFMGIASINDEYQHANETALRYWVGTFGEGVLGIALTDTFGTPSFLKAFRQKMPTIEQAKVDSIATSLSRASHEPNGSVSHPNIRVEGEKSGPAVDAKDSRSYAQIFNGVRQDSGDPVDFVKLMRDFYDKEGITDRKTIVFSDSLNVEKCIRYKEAAENASFQPTFGIGTFLTNDYHNLSDGGKSKPLNIVIKLSTANGKPAIKISDNIGKNTGDSETVRKVKESLGYVEKEWSEGDERQRWT